MKVSSVCGAGFSYLKKEYSPSFKSYEMLGGEDLSAYDNYSGKQPPKLEVYKYERSVEAQNHIERGEYAQAANIKLELAQICRGQGKFDDADKLIDGAKKLLDEMV